MTLLLLGCGGAPDLSVAPPANEWSADTAPGPVDDTADTGDPTLDTGDTGADTAGDTGPVGTDADADGVSVEAGDCDDGNPTVYPGAEEWCDPLDHDCDGEPLAAGVCAKEQAVEQLWTTSWTPDASWADDGVYVALDQSAGFVGDLDGDGREEVLVGCDNCSWFTTGSGGSNAYLLPGGTVGRDLEPTSRALGWWWGSGGYVPGTILDLGDWNGDGVPDMMMTTADVGGQEGVVRILYGPSSRWPTGTDADSAADVRFYSTGMFGFGGLAMAPGDFDGDGLADVAAATYDDGEGWSPNAIWLLPGRADAEAEPYVRDESWLFLGEEDVGVQEFVKPGDLDGDGADDLVLSTATDGDWAFAVVAGADLRAGSGGNLDDVALARLSGGDTNNTCLISAGDLDSDGHADWAAGVRKDTYSFDDPGALYAVSGAHRTSGEVEYVLDAAAGWWTGTVERAIGSDCGSGDVDGDGAPELLVERSDITVTRDIHYQWAAARTQGMPAPGDPFPQSLVLLRPEDDSDSLLMSQVPQIGDYDGDGFNDILLSGYHESDELGMGGFVIIPGWDIPWDDAAYW